MNRQNLIWITASFLLSVATIFYFVNNPGGKMAARLLNFETITKAYQQHILMVFVASAAAIIVSVSLGILITRPFFSQWAPIVDNIVNIAQPYPVWRFWPCFSHTLAGGSPQLFLRFGCTPCCPYYVILRQEFRIFRQESSKPPEEWA